MTARPDTTAVAESAVGIAAGDEPKPLSPLVGHTADRWEQAADELCDAPERTQAEVVAALRAAAEKARTASAVGSPVAMAFTETEYRPQSQKEG